MKNWLLPAIWSAILLLNSNLFGQPVPVQIGTIYDISRNQSFALFNNNALVQLGNPMNRGFVARDPSGRMNLMLPSTAPHLAAFFLDWNNQLVELNQYGYFQKGYCQCPKFTNPWMFQYQPPHYDPNIGVEFNNRILPTPRELFDPERPYGSVMITSENNAKQCYNEAITPQGLNRDAFMECMMPKLMGQKEIDILNCVRNSKTDEERTLCLMEKLGGSNERAIANKLRNCYQQYGTDYGKYPLCLAGQQGGNGEFAKVIRCIEEQSRNGKVDFLSTAVCYGAKSLDLNPETQIIITCAVTTGGQPYAFAGCAGGQLLSRELDKCFTNGVGGSNGCFGPNNSIKLAFEDATMAIQQAFPGNTLVRHWSDAVRDLTIGPGPNNTAIKTIQNISNEVGRAPNNVGKAIKKITPRFKL